jgi:predicted permease
MLTILRDLRFAVRQLLKTPGITLAAVLSLALGIGANTVVFTWVRATILSPLRAVTREDEIVIVSGRSKSGALLSLSYPDYVDYRDRNRTLAGLLVQRNAAMSLTSGDRPERVYGMIVSGTYFDVLGVKPVVGRGFRPEEDRTPGSHPVVVLNYALWQRRFGGDPRIVGRTITLNARPFTVVGVAPRAFIGTAFGLATDLWVPVMMQHEIVSGGDRLAANRRGLRWLSGLARLKPGVSVAQARADLNVVADQLGRSFPLTDEGVGVDLYTLRQAPGGAGKVLAPVFTVLGAVVALVLLIACANVANLLLGRAVDRQREVAIRLSLGATRTRLFLQFLTESVLLALAGGLGGLLVARWTSGLLLAFVPPTDQQVALALDADARVFVFAMAVSLATGVLFGIVPAFHASRRQVAGALQEERGSIASGRRRSVLRNGLVVAQVALSVVLLVGAGLFLRALSAAQNVDPGFDARNIVLAGIDLFPNGYERDRGIDFYQRLLERVRALPGVQSAALARQVPLDLSGSSSMGITVEGYVPGEREEMTIEFNIVSPDYFRTLGIPVTAGREFTWQDRGARPDAIIVNETMARRFWKGGNPTGKRVRVNADWCAVVGVVGDIKFHTLTDPPSALMFLPLAQRYQADQVLHVKASGDGAALVPAVRAEIRGMDGNLPVYGVQMMAERVGLALFTQRIAGTLLAIFGGLALALASVGLYGVVAYAARQRWHELGIRMALGATPSEVRTLVVRHGFVLALAGLALGVLAAWPLTRLVVSQLHGVSPTDPLTFVAVGTVMMAIAVLASFIPARRASRLDPIATLRHE